CAGGCSASATSSGACSGAGPRRSVARTGPRPVTAGARSLSAAGAPPVAATSDRGRPEPAGAHAGSRGGAARWEPRLWWWTWWVRRSAWRIRRWQPRLWWGTCGLWWPRWESRRRWWWTWWVRWSAWRLWRWEPGLWWPRWESRRRWWWTWW